MKNFLELSYEELEEKNLDAKARSHSAQDASELADHYRQYLEKEKGLKAVTVAFSDLEGRLHTLDYDKKFLIKSCENLTFDGSSVRGLTEVDESDLRLQIDWGSFRWLPSDIFGAGKVIVFGLINDRDGSSYPSDMRGKLKSYATELWRQNETTANVSFELEGFLFEGQGAEQNFGQKNGFEFVSRGGYYNALPRDPLKLFIDTFAEAQRAMGFENEKDHPEVAPSQFELNYSPCGYPNCGRSSAAV